MSLHIKDSAAMTTLGSKLACTLEGGELIYLVGELGAGKTTLAQGLIAGLGHEGSVKSPTYTLVEPYSINDKSIYHFDLYRLNDPEELEAMGIRDYCDGAAICLFEWPERGEGILPEADLIVSIQHQEQGREMELTAKSKKGERIIEIFDKET